MTSPAVTLKSGQTYSDTKSGTTIIGSTGEETVSIAAKIVDAVISKVETVKLSGKVADYVLSDSGAIVSVKQGDATIASITPADKGTSLLFSDGSKAVLTTSSATAAHTYSIWKMAAKSVFNVTADNISIKGATGSLETVNLSTEYSNVTIDSNVDKVAINANYGDLTLSGIKAGLSLIDGAGTKIADLMIGQTKKEILEFANASGTLSLSGGKGVFTLSSINVDESSPFTTNADGITIGAANASDANKAVLAPGFVKEHVTSAIGEVDLPGKYTDFKYLNKSGLLYVYDSKGKTVVADIQVQTDDTGTSLVFSDGTELKASISKSAIHIGEALVSATKAASLVMPFPSSPATSEGVTSSFQYSIHMGNFGKYQDALLTDMTTALERLGKYLDAKGVFNLDVQPVTIQNGILAQASGNMAWTPSDLLKTEHGAKITSEFQIESLTGTDPVQTGYDAVVKINMHNIGKMNLDPNAAPSLSQWDMTSTLTHELFHAIGFGGYTGSKTTDKTPFDTFISMVSGKPYFTGPNAVAIYGGPVPLAPASAGTGSAYYHVDIQGDLMSVAIGNGQVRGISAIDLAMLRDIGVPEVSLVGTQAILAG